MSKIFQNKNILQKIAIVLLITLMCYFIIPTYSFAGWGGDMLKVLTQLLAALGDAVMGAMNHFMLGTDRMISSVMLPKDNPSITESGGALYAGDNDADIVLDQSDEEEEIDGGLWDTEDEWQVPNLLYSPEAIFSNRIAALDVNFLSPNRYKDVQTGNYVDPEDDAQTNSEKHAKSSAEMLKETIGSWYVAFRNIAIVALLTVLVYIGIRILISSTSSDKAKYKESLKDWLVALCLVFVLHFIMSGILMLTEQVTTLFDNSTSGIIVEVDGLKFKESLMGVARLRVQSTDAGISAVFCIMYLVLVVYTIIFTITYLKRFLYMAFLTMIAPLVAITYPIDKLGDGKAQAFNMWFKEYTMNAILQPLHLILYTTLVTSAQDLVKENFIYALVAIGFMIPAEKFVKKMFGFDKAQTPGTLGGFAAGALTMKGLSNMAKAKPHLPTGNNGGGNNKIRTAGGKEGVPLTGKSEYDGLDTVNFGNEGLGAGNGTTTGSGNGGNAGAEQLPDNAGGANSQQQESGNGGTDNNMQQQNEEQSDDNNQKDPINDGYSQLIPGFNINDYTNTAPTWKDNAKQGMDNLKNKPLVKKSIKGAKNMANKVWTNRGKIGRGALKGIGMGAKGLAIAGTTTMGAMTGLAMGVATGDMSKAISYTGAGLASGFAIGKNVSNGVAELGKSAKGGLENIYDKFNEKTIGYAAADDKRQKRIDKRAKYEFMKNKEQLAQAKKTQIKLSREGQNVDIKDIMESRYDYVAAGIQNDEQIQRAQLAEARSGGINGSTHGNYVSISQEADRLGINASTFSDTKKYNEFHDTLSASLGSEENGARAMEMMAEIRGANKANSAQQARRSRQHEQPRQQHNNT